jgi:hypothetical protein
MTDLVPVHRYATYDTATIVLECGHSQAIHPDNVPYYRRLCEHRMTICCGWCPAGYGIRCVADVIVRR